MQPLILKYSEPVIDELKISELEYDESMQLNVLKGTKTPVFNAASFQTNTFTKTIGEAEDNDRSSLYATSYTVTHSANHNTADDRDNDVKKQSFYFAGTMTNTRTQIESTDSDN